jgi:hypothetical protein
MTFARGDKVWWHDPQHAERIHHGWVEGIESDGLGLAQVGAGTQVVPPRYVHAEDDQPPVSGCALCMSASLKE